MFANLVFRRLKSNLSLDSIIHVKTTLCLGISYGRGGQTFRSKGRIGKNLEAEGRTDWKS